MRSVKKSLPNDMEGTTIDYVGDVSHRDDDVALSCLDDMVA